MTIDTEKLRALLAALHDKNHPNAAEVDWHRVAVAAVNALPELLDALDFERRENAEHERNADEWQTEEAEHKATKARLATAEADRLTLARALERSRVRWERGLQLEPEHNVYDIAARIVAEADAAAAGNGAITRKCIDEAADKVDAIAAYAAGYARAERDVAEAAKKQATKKRERDWSGDEVAACALEDFADNIEQGAYRGAAKDEAPRGEGGE